MKSNIGLIGMLGAGVILGSSQDAHSNNPPGARESWESVSKVGAIEGFFEAWDDDGTVTNIIVYNAPSGFSQSDENVLGWRYEATRIATNYDIAFQAVDNLGALSSTNYLHLDIYNTFPRAIYQSVESQEGENTFIMTEGTDDDGDPLSFTVVDSVRPEHGSVNRVGPMFTYSADKNYFGKDRFQFRVYDGQDSGEAYVDIDVLPTERPFEILSLSRNGTNSTLTAKLQPNRTYVLEESQDLSNWSDVTTHSVPFSTNDFTEIHYDFSDTNNSSYYRIRKELR